MVIENTKTALRIWVRNLISTILLVIIIIILYMARLLEEPVLGIGQVHITVFLSAIYLYLILVPVVLGYQFIYISDEDQKFHVKYFTIGFIPGGRKSFEFPLREFYKFEIEESFFKLRKNIVIFRKVKKGIAKYPSLSLTGLSTIQQNQLIVLFRKLSSK